jgi:hypothetical protein
LAVLARTLQAAQLDHRLPVCFLCRHAGGDVSRRRLLKMKAQLVIQLIRLAARK